MTAFDKPTAPNEECRHPRARHWHGTYLSFLRDGCRCDLCAAAHRRNNKMTTYRTVTGTHSYTDAESAREHVRQLLETLTISQIEQRSGVHRTAIRVLIGDVPGRPASKRITKRTEAALLAVTGERVGAEDHGLVDGTGTVRRLQALMALGWCRRWLEARLTMSTRTGWLLTRTPGPHLVTVGLRDRVIATYNDIAMTPPPATRYAARTRNLARAAGWPPPLAWDDDTIDDPKARPDRSRARSVADLDEFLFLVRSGENPARAAQRLGVGVNAIERAAGRKGRRDVLDVLSREGRAA